MMASREYCQALHAPQGHVLAQPDAVALAHVPLSLQVLRVRDPSDAPARARRGRAADRPRGAPPRQGAAGAHRRGARSPPRRAAPSSPSSASTDFTPMWCGRASGRSSAGCSRTRTSACSSRDDLANLREVTASQGLMLESVNPDLVAHQGSPTKHPERRLATIRGRRRAADPVHQRHPRRDRRVRGRPHGVARGARGLRSPAGGDPAELRPAPALLRRGAGRHRDRRGRGVLAHGAARGRRCSAPRSGRRRCRSTT